MESITTVRGRRPQDYPGYATAEILAGLIVSAWRATVRWLDAAARARRNEEARRELHKLSDHYLKDIGLDRAQINRLFR